MNIIKKLQIVRDAFNTKMFRQPAYPAYCVFAKGDIAQASIDIMGAAYADGIVHIRAGAASRISFFQENDFRIEIKKDDTIALTCPADFAEKIKQLASVADVKPLQQLPRPTFRPLGR